MQVWRMVVIGVVAGVWALGAAGCGPGDFTVHTGKPPGPVDLVASAPVPVVVEAVQLTREQEAVEAAGWLVWKDEVSLGFVAGGVIGEVAVRAGERVEAGTVLARLRPEELDGRLGQARANVERWRQDLERGRRLLATGVMTREQVEHLETAVTDGEGQLKAAEFARRHGEVLAPAAGWVLMRRAEPGQVVAAGTPVVDFAGESGGWLVRVGLPEGEVRRLKVGDRGEAWLGTGGGVVPGRLARISGGVDAVTRLVPVELELERVPDGVRSGFAMNVRLVPGPGEQRWKLAASALVDGRGREAWVYRVEGGRVRRTRVQVEWFQGGRACVRGELPEGSRVVVRGVEFLRDGSEVKEVSGESSVAANR